MIKKLTTRNSQPVTGRGFTLIELLVVISLIGILTTLVLSNLSAGRERGRDAQRKANLRSIQTALSLYYSDIDIYPASNSAYVILGCGAGVPPVSTCSWGGSWVAGSNTYMNKLPADPVPSYSYRYTGIDSDNYTLQACLENESDDVGMATLDTTWCPGGWMYQVAP